MTFEERIEKLNQLIAESKNTVFFGGAGVSTESGIPDFRSKDGLYNQKDINFEQYSPEYLLSFTCLHHNPKVFYEFYRQKLDCRDIKPNITHKVLADMEQEGKLNAIITQNIDGLHQKAGSKNVYEIHGTTEVNYCTKCGTRYPSDYIFNSEDKIPKCSKCNGIVRPAVTLYEEPLPKIAWGKAEEAIGKANLIIIGGTSLSVYPAANLITYKDYYSSDKYKKMVIINRDETYLDGCADLVFHESLGEVFSKIKY